MSTQHTQGRIVVNPIQLDQIATPDASKEIARVTHFGHTADTVIANARRLAACWNACDGISTGDLEKAGTIAAEVDDEIQAELLKAWSQRDELLAALQALCDEYGKQMTAMNHKTPRRAKWTAALAAIAKATGESK